MCGSLTARFLSRQRAVLRVRPGITDPASLAYVDEAAVLARFDDCERAYVEVELTDGSRFAVDSVSAEPGFGFVTLSPHPDDDRAAPASLVVPLGAIRRIEIDRVDEEEHPFGFTPSSP